VNKKDDEDQGRRMQQKAAWKTVRIITNSQVERRKELIPYYEVNENSEFVDW